jgi:N-acetyl-anhydromuramyl-L-alanine amidase AmpD
MKKLNLNSIIQTPLPATQYYREVNLKTQIVLHHTAGGTLNSTLSWWKLTPARIATAFLIDRDGSIHQCFHSSYWAHHLGTKLKTNTQLNKQSIGIELCNWGPLTRKPNQKPDEVPTFLTYIGKELPISDAVMYPEGYRGYQFYQKYTTPQLESLKLLLEYLGEKYDIPCEMQDDIWEVNPLALGGEKGVFSHGSYRKDKSDCHPQLQLRNLFDLRRV